MTERQFNKAEFRRRLLDCEARDDLSRQPYERSIRALITQELSRGQRIAFALISIVLGALSALAILLSMTLSTLPWLARLLFVEAAVLQVIVMAYLIHVLRRGVFNRRQQPKVIAGLAWIAAVMVSIHLVALSPFAADTKSAIAMCGLGSLVLIGAGVSLLRTQIEQSELNTHERMLKLAATCMDARLPEHRDPEAEAEAKSSGT